LGFLLGDFERGLLYGYFLWGFKMGNLNREIEKGILNSFLLGIYITDFKMGILYGVFEGDFERGF